MAPKLLFYDDVKRDLGQGLSHREVAVKYGVKVTTVGTFCSKNRLLTSTKKLFIDEVKNDLNSGLGHKAIALKYGCKRSTVKMFCSRNGIRPNWDLFNKPGTLAERFFESSRPKATNFNRSSLTSNFDFFDPIFGFIDVKSSTLYEAKTHKGRYTAYKFRFNLVKSTTNLLTYTNPDFFVCYCLNQYTDKHFCFRIPGSFWSIRKLDVCTSSKGDLGSRSKWLEYFDQQLSDGIDPKLVSSFLLS